jgi:acyl-CoA reductase-like NAD-dependent aldehyde dehydrogenase
MKIMKVTTPYDNKLIQTVEIVDSKTISKALDDAYEYYINKNKWLKKYEIIKILEKTISIMEDRFESLILIAVKEGGKPYIDSKIEVQRAIGGIKIAIEHLGSYKGETIPMGHTISSDNRLAFTIKEPIGVVVAISAFNHPLNLAIHQIIPAIAVGAPVIIKPSTRTPLSALNFVKILHEAGLPKNMCQAYTCDRIASELLVSSPKSAFLTFIGSANVGWHLNSISSPGTRVALEHGGVAPVIINNDASIDKLIPLIIKGGFYHAGQVCVSVQRVYIHKDIIDDVTSKLVKETIKLKIGNPLDKKTDIGPLITYNEVDRIENWVDDAKNNGAIILCGGKRLNDSCYEPTIILNPKADDMVSKNEVFGPVICLYSFDNINDALNSANSLDVSFQASIFTQNIDIALKVSKKIDATAIMINDHTAFRVDWMPFGGAKTSGLGMGGIINTMEEMSNEKMIVIKSNSL